MPLFTDQTGRCIDMPDRPGRIISLVPSQTELLYHLGLDHRVAGITKFCIHPTEWFRSKPRVGGTKTLHLDRIAALQPDCILANKEENVQEQVETLARQYPVWTSDIHTLEDALSMIRSIGRLTGALPEADALAADIEEGFARWQIQCSALYQQPIPTAYLIWKDPWMTVGQDTFIHDLLQRCGLYNVFGHLPRYPAISIEQLQAAQPALLLLSSEPYPFKEKHLAALQTLLPHTSIRLADGEAFSWYGSRLLHSPAYFRELLGDLIHNPLQKK
ncbi:MAG: helical backbone metal receptor [Candidatus Pseudobacter hemicellulosilyticus]|uniref:Helical backbone metal receptor n=1 Tax=Candidatus Pseudobacter hemicellulosilyticus TaxID=3121375 RepID=A0AAJ5WNN4_9BACT|nr:MAG: helical backbone metal receptor [Pseudobacter sp.]